ncbi:hypothetical protein N752_04705 [Desulforamulus aquiferis]|nr:hypothetical protein N752_04705 [Desulforamulus aquiferis]
MYYRLRKAPMILATLFLLAILLPLMAPSCPGRCRRRTQNGRVN